MSLAGAKVEPVRTCAATFQYPLLCAGRACSRMRHRINGA